MTCRRERDCLLADWGAGRRVLYFHGHYDVVPAASPAQFQPRIRGRKLYGRGAADMKGGLAAMIYAVAALAECKAPLNGRIRLVFVPDEETGGARGSAWLAHRGLLGRDGIGMLTPEPSGGMVWNAIRGALSLRVALRGKSAHVGLAHTGVNAFERMHGLAGKLLAIEREIRRRNSILLVGGECRGGASFNTVPAECSFTVDRRTNPGEDFASECRRIERLLRGRGVEVEELQRSAPLRVAEESPLARALAASIHEVTGRPARFQTCPGLLETRFYAARGVPALAYGPGKLNVSHSPHESVNLRDVTECAAVYALTALSAL